MYCKLRKARMGCQSQKLQRGCVPVCLCACLCTCIKVKEAGWVLCECFCGAELSIVQTLLACKRPHSSAWLCYHGAVPKLLWLSVVQYWVNIPTYIITNVGVQFSTGQCRDVIGYYAYNYQIYLMFSNFRRWLNRISKLQLSNRHMNCLQMFRLEGS